MYKVEQRIRMEGYTLRFEGDDNSGLYYDRIVDTKLLKECNDEFETADYFINNIHNMAMDFMLELHNLKEGEEYVHRLDHLYCDDRLKTHNKNVKIGFEVEIVITRI